MAVLPVSTEEGTQSDQPLRVVLWSTLVVGALLITWRSWDALGRLPSDPGFDYFADAWTRGPVAIFGLDPYLHFCSRIIAYVVSFLPLDTQTLATGHLVNLIWVACAAGVAVIIARESGSSLVGIAAGLALVINPAARESALANVGNVKWPLTVLAVACCASPSILRRRRWWVVALLLILGISHPLAVLVAIPLILNLEWDRTIDRRLFALPLTIVLTTFVIQVAIVGWDRSTGGHGSSRFLKPWPGMSGFWWFGLASPAVVALVAIALSVSAARRGQRNMQLAATFSVTALILGITSYVLGGIADRYFIAPMVLGWVAAALIMHTYWRSGAVALKALVVLGAFAFAMPAARWFPAGGWLTSGPLWSNEVVAARSICLADPNATVQIGVSPSSAADVPCALVNDR